MKAGWNVTQRVIISSIPALQTIQIDFNFSNFTLTFTDRIANLVQPCMYSLISRENKIFTVADLNINHYLYSSL